MAESKKQTKPERTKTKKEPEVNARIIWLYAVRLHIVLQNITSILKHTQTGMNLREKLGISFSDSVIIIPPNPSPARVKLLQQLKDQKDVIILIPGISHDRSQKKITKHYEGTELAWFHPPKKQFHIDMMRESQPISYGKAAEIKKEATKAFGEFFAQENIHIIENYD